MTRSRNPHRPDLARQTSKKRSALRRTNTASRLAESAGLARADHASPEVSRPEFEALENRQLLFTLTITPDLIDPLTNVGTAVVDFGYFIPYFFATSEVGTEGNEVFTEDFNQGPLGGVPSPFTFDQSDIRVRHNATNATIVGNNQQNTLQVSLQPGEFIHFQVAPGDTPDPVAPWDDVESLISFAMDATNLDATNLTVELRLRDGVVATFTGAELLALSSTGTPNGRFTFNAPVDIGAFDEVRIVNTGGAAVNFTLDNLEATALPGNFSDIVESRLFGARLAFTGPLGATVQVLDLYGRDMQATLRMGRWDDAINVLTFDLNDDGIPDGNDGIGQINITGAPLPADARLNDLIELTIIGGTIVNNQTTGEPEFAYPTTTLGLADDFEEAGMGFVATFPAGGGLPTVTGLPPAAGSVIIGSPFVRPLNNYNPGGGAQFTGFNTAGQGVFVQGGIVISSIYMHALTFGASRITGAADRWAVANMMGSLFVNGDLGKFIVGGDAGIWTDDDGTPSARTNSNLSVGRTLGEFVVGGRSMMNTTVTGDLNSPSTRPPRDVLRHYETESFGAVNPPDINGWWDSIFFLQGSKAFAEATGIYTGGQPILFGTTTYRNTSIQTAEWVGSIATAVEIHGWVGDNDFVNTADDPSDLYSFAADGTKDITVRLTAGTFGTAVYFRVVDKDGRTVAVPEFGITDAEEAALRFRPSQPGVYYLVVQGPSNATTGQPVGDSPYTLTIAGMEPVTLGSYRTGASSGSWTLTGNLINVLSGSMGDLRIGTGFLGGGAGGGGFVDPAAVFNVSNNADENDVDEYTSLRSMSISVSRNLYSVYAGSDIEGDPLFPVDFPVRFVIGGNLGTVVTGQNPTVGISDAEGDLRNADFNVGGSIGMLDIRATIGTDHDATTWPNALDLESSVIIRTGTVSTMRGDIGMIRVGSHVGADSLIVRTSNGSVIGAVLISQDVEIDGADPNVGIYAPGGNGDGITFNTGINSDVRFMDVPQIDLNGQEDHRFDMVPGVPLTFTDDSGAQVSIQIIGGNANAGGIIRVLPVNGSLGVIISRIEVNLEGGARLQITGVGAATTDVISIGRIIVTESDEAGTSSIGIDGNIQTDVYRIDHAGENALLEIVNTTPRGDLVAVDVGAMPRLEIRTGDLGRTEVPAWGPKLIGPFLGIADDDGGGEAGGPISLNPDVITGFWNGGTYRPVNDPNSLTSYLDDVGGPFDPYLNGLRVRSGNITEVLVGGAVGDVLATGDEGGNIVQVTANFDNLTPTGRFDGIIGTIYARHSISNVDIGDGLARPENNSILTTGIFANDSILLVEGTRPGAFISSSIVAANNAPAVGFPTPGIDRIVLSGGGSYIDAFIGGTNLDAFWSSTFALDAINNPGTVRSIEGIDANFFRSRVHVGQFGTMTLTRGFYDASTILSAGNIVRVEAQGFRNTTALGSLLELRPSEITASGNIGVITTTGMAGDMQDLTIDAGGRVNEVSARNIVRTSIDGDIAIDLVRAMDSVRATSISGGILTLLTAGNSIRSSEIRVAGPIESILAGDAITNTTIVVSGPDGRIGTIVARSLITGNITSVGTIDLIEATEGDLRARITTLMSIRGVPGNIGTLRAGRDLDIVTDIAGTVDHLIAGRHIGNQFLPTVILVRGDLVSLEAPNGQLYADIRIGGSLTEGATIGPAFNKPTGSNLGTGSIVAFGRIEKVDINGDFGASIISYSGGIGVVTINDGSLLPTGQILAFDGNLQNLFINAGNLYGRVHADYTIFAIRLNASEDGVFGDIGVNPAFNSGVSYSQFRNQLPPGVIFNSSIQGPRITAGHNLGRIILTNGSIFEAFIHAGRALGTIDVTGNIQNDPATSGTGTVIAAGSSIFLVRASGNIENAIIIAGVKDFGADEALGGTGSNADTINSGRITTVHADGAMTNVKVSAGMNAGADGVYNTGDESVSLGISFIREVTAGGAVNNVSAFADSPTLTVSGGVVRAGTAFPLVDPDLSSGVAGPGETWTLIPGNGSTFNFTWNGVSGTITFVTDKGQAFWDSTNGRVVLVNTSLNSELIVSASGTLTNFDIVSNDDASMGLVRVDTNLAGDSRIVIDAYVLAIHTQGVFNSGTIRVGMNVRNITTGTFFGNITAALWARDIIINGDLGTTDSFDEASIRALAAGTITVNNTNAGLISIDRDLASLTVNGPMNRAQFRVGNSVGLISAGSIKETRISVGDDIGTITVAGDVTDTQIQSGGDLGTDVLPGGTGSAEDRATSGNIGDVTIGGSLVRSSIVAGLLRGSDGFFGTEDDVIAPGRSAIDSVNIAGDIVGSNLNTEEFRILATGNLGTIAVGGQQPGPDGNFESASLAGQTMPTPIRVTNVTIGQDSQTFQATITFNQSMNVDTIGPALTIVELRDGGATQVPLVQGTDYFISGYDAETNSVIISFAREVTEANLPQQPGVPGPGVFRFVFEGDVLRASVAASRLDANGDGFTDGDDYSADFVVGDAGDKITPETVGTVDFYGPADLDLVFDNNLIPDTLPDTNVRFTITGVIGDHPDQDPGIFPAGGDTDLYKITLQAGQILRLGAMQGAALFAGRFLLDANGQFVSFEQAMLLPSDFELLDPTFPEDYLIKQTGVYYIAVTNAFPDFLIPGSVPQVEPDAGTVGDYRFAIEVFDDRDSGFNANTDAGNGADIVDAPIAQLFAGNNGVFEPIGAPNSDDRTSIVIGAFTFFLDAGADGVRGTADDIVSGNNGNGITSTRQNGVLTTTIDSAIGPRGHAGVPGETAADVDVYHLNNGQPIAPGTRITVRVQLAELGADLGSFSQETFTQFFNDVQFGLFDTTGATGIDDALLVFSPTDFAPIAREPGNIATRGPITYGYDAKGDFFITFVTPDRIGGTPGEAGTFAVYIQGVFNTDYTLQITQADPSPVTPLPQTTQNIFIETFGGTVDWLQAGGLTTKLDPFAASVLGFTGLVGGVPVSTYIVNNLVANLRAAFTAAGLNVNISSNRADFEFQPFSTVFLTSSSDPINIFDTVNYGYSEHSDPMNADLNDEAVIFAPSFSDLGYTPSRADIDAFVNSLTAAVGRRVGELMGLRIEADADPSEDPFPIMAANGPLAGVFGVTTYRYNNESRALSDPFDSISNTNFFLGRQNAFALLDKFLTP